MINKEVQHTIHQSLEQDMQVIEALKDVLEQELTALKEINNAQYEQVIDAKTKLLLQLEDNFNYRSKYLAELNLINNAPTIKQIMDFKTDYIEKYLAAITEIHELNNRNGQVIAVTATQINRINDLFLGRQSLSYDNKATTINNDLQGKQYSAEA